MKRPPGLWILLSAGVLWLSLQDVYGIRATSLIFGKSTTSTTTSTETPQNLDEETATSTEHSSTEVSNVTKPTLTGNPQIDYIWDPNLPKELNGHNLSDYPFYERVPEDIDFKCDGLHDGFYASVLHKCQVYHHCLFGTRYDFLCANYTAFDQKTFICHFASEVDCANSKKFWHRNDALYQAQSTTTTKPLVIHTTAPPIDPITPLPAQVPRRPMGGRRPYRPNRRRRPQLEYYDDEYYDDEYYEERPRSNRGRKRPRPRPRPVYDDEEYDDEYEEDRYEKRGGNRRRPYDRRPSDRRRNKEKRKRDYDDDVVDERFEDEDYLPDRRRGEAKRKHSDGEPEETVVDRKEPKDRISDKRRSSTEESIRERKPNRKGFRRPASDEYEDDQVEDTSSYESRPRKNERNKPAEDSRPIIKPVSGTIYDRPRVAPRINLPVPKNAANKYAYKAIGSKPLPPKPLDEEYYEDYEEEPLPKISKSTSKSTEASVPKQANTNRDNSKESRNPAASASRQRPRRPDDENSYESSPRPKFVSNRPKFALGRTTPSQRKKPTTEEYYDEYEDETSINDQKTESKSEKSSTTTTTPTTTTTTTTSTEAPKEKSESIVRIVKRPFLPSRGGNPYSPRGLQPVGVKALDNKPEQTATTSEQPVTQEVTRPIGTPVEETNKGDRKVELPARKFKPSPIVIKVPIRTKFLPSAEAQEVFDSESSRPQVEVRQHYKEFAGPRTTQKPKVIEKDPLDLNEYDVTLNDALNPTLPNLPVRAFPTGFSSGNDYTQANYQRTRYVLEPVLSPSSSEFVYETKPVRQQIRYEAVPQSHIRDHFINSNVDYKGQYSTLNANYRHRNTPARQTQALYANY